MDKKKVKELIQEVIRNNVDSLEFGNDKHNAPLRKANSLLHDALIELGKSDWVSVKNGLPPIDEEVIVLTTADRIYFGHIVDKKIAKDYKGWNIPDIEYWQPFVDPKEE
jgi:hypothetical protein